MRSPLFFIGIAGSGMCPLALLAHSRGIKVAGYDQKNSPYVELLKKNGIPVFLGYQNIEDLTGYQIVVSTAINEANPYYNQAKEKSLSIIHRSDLLCEFLSDATNGICVSGSHGKTTTTAMIAFLLDRLQVNPTAYVGGEMCNYHSPALCGDMDYMVIEADESDGSFLKNRPYAAVLTNADLDHLDFYKNEKNLMAAFSNYLGNVAENGFIVLNEKDRGLCPPSFKGKKVSFSTQNKKADFFADQIQFEDNGIKFKLHALQNKFEVKLAVLGLHNVENAISALATMNGLGFDLELCISHFQGFIGVKRRLQFIYHSESFSIIDDYAHNPGKIRACLAAVRMAYPQSNLLIVFQLHRYTRMATLYDEFCRSFIDASHCIVLPVYSAGEEDVLNLGMEKFCIDIAQASSCSVSFAVDFEAAFSIVKQNLKKNTVVITLGAGNVTDFGEFLLAHPGGQFF